MSASMAPSFVPPHAAQYLPGGAQTQPCAKDLLEALASPAHLVRDRALLVVPKLESSQLSILSTALVDRLVPEGAWEVTMTALQASSAVLAAPSATLESSASFSHSVLPHVPPLIPHTEARVRSAAATLIGNVARVLGPMVWDETHGELLGNIERNFNLDDEQRLSEADRIAKRDMEDAVSAPRDRGLRMVHETEGWRGLETSLLAIGEVIAGCGGKLLSRAQNDLAQANGVDTVLSYIGRAKTHPNRFVREAGLRLLACITDACVEANAVTMLCDISDQLLDVVSEGLQDNWSQVRYNSSVAVRKLMAGLPVDSRRNLYPVLLPRMCLNRHYVAEGVRVYSQETWRDVVGADGRVYLVQLLENVISFYESQCNADNHAVREAACQSLAEATTRLESTAVKPFVPRIVNALVECFKDESWPVRDYACTALAAVASHFGPDVEATGRLGELFDLFSAHLGDNIVSVRENAAVSIVKAARPFPVSHPVLGLQKLCETAAALLPKISEQKEQKFTAPENGSASDCPRRDRHTGYGAAAKLARDNDVELHTGQVMYSCGSLAPKLRRGGGCMDHGFSRPKEPWEETDGGFRLWSRLAEAGGEGSKLAGSLMPLVIDSLSIVTTKEFAHTGQASEFCWSSVAIAACHVPRESWSPDLLATAAGLAEKTSRAEHARAAAAARSAVNAMRRAVGFDAYSAVSATLQGKN